MAGRIKARYRMDNDSFGEFIRSEQIRGPVYDAAQDIAKAAAALAPRGKEDGSHMADQYEAIREAGEIEVAGNIRVKCEVVNPARNAAVVEFGRKGKKGQAPLRNAAAPFGDLKPDGMDF